MIKQSITTINYNLLYEILEEIKGNLPFKIINYKSEEDFIRDNSLHLKNSLIILRSDQKFCVNKNLNKKNFLNLSELPISIKRLIELINIQLIRLKFNYQSKIIVNGYELDLNSKFLSKDSINLKLTEKEVDIILYLINNKTKHNVLSLLQNIWGYSSEMETHTVETHIYRLRKKVGDIFNDNNFILSHNEGYFIQ